MSKCLDCGCTLNGGICSNCHEELFIQTYQTEDLPDDFSFSQDFADKATQQNIDIKERNKIIREDPEAFKDLSKNDTYYK